MNLKDCFEKRLLKKITIDKEKVANSVKIAENKFIQAKQLIEADFFNDCLVNAYTSMFHAARALLYNDGIQEKSHYAVYIYLNEKYSYLLGNNLIESFFNSQLERHEAIYGFDSMITLEKAESILEDAECFFE